MPARPLSDVPVETARTARRGPGRLGRFGCVPDARSGASPEAAGRDELHRPRRPPRTPEPGGVLRIVRSPRGTEPGPATPPPPPPARRRPRPRPVSRPGPSPAAARSAARAARPVWAPAARRTGSRRGWTPGSYAGRGTSPRRPRTDRRRGTTGRRQGPRPRPDIRSGAMNSREPTNSPLMVRDSSPWMWAMPKSVSTTRPCCPSSTLAGFTSRCTMPLACAAFRAPTTASPIRADSAGRAARRAAAPRGGTRRGSTP